MTMQDKTFEVTEQHLALLRRAYVSWDTCEYGAPQIDPKRPYGNSSVLLDIAEILGVRTDDERDDYGLDPITRERLERLHRETQTVLQIVLATGEFRVGSYVAPAYTARWRRAG